MILLSRPNAEHASALRRDDRRISRARRRRPSTPASTMSLGNGSTLTARCWKNSRAAAGPSRKWYPAIRCLSWMARKSLGKSTFVSRLQVRYIKMAAILGYQIRPRARNKGYATAGLRLALERLKDIGLSEALLTVSETNAASIRVIEKIGAVRIDDAQLDDGTTNRRYIADIASLG